MSTILEDGDQQASEPEMPDWQHTLEQKIVELYDVFRSPGENRASKRRMEEIVDMMMSVVVHQKVPYLDATFQLNQLLRRYFYEEAEHPNPQEKDAIQYESRILELYGERVTSALLATRRIQEQGERFRSIERTWGG